MSNEPSKQKTVYSIIDIETTGGHKNGNKITEIAIINFDGEKIIEEWSSLINPERNIPKAITYLTGIDNQMVAKAPKFFEVAKKIVQMTEGNVFVAHNVFFDYNFIKHEFADLGYKYQREKLCTVRLARKSLPGHKSYSLGKICQDLGIEIEARHRALGDAKATVELFKHIQKVSPHQVNEIISDEGKKISLPPKLSRAVYDSIPVTPGVYYFYDESGELLYVGKAKELKKRISSHFRPDMKRKKDIELKNKVAHVDYKEMGSEVAALLFECHEIKKLRPPYNRAMNRTRFPYRLVLQKRQSGEFVINLTKTIDEDTHMTFASRLIAEKARDALYRAVLGFNYGSLNFDQARCNIIDKLGVDHYNSMLEKVFTKNLSESVDYEIELPGRHNMEKCVIQIRKRNPVKIIFQSDEDCESIDLHSDQDMMRILSSCFQKFKIKKLFLTENFQ
ncbi:MAG: DNA polymerase III subunit epsilon [Deltaproteobacteria bacterium]|nr:MAG: DNA polymerase III subunit epsilon [Deltaproteobacteria bacterium]